MKDWFREINQVLERLKQLVSIPKHIMSLKLLRKRKNFKDMEMN